ncbi:hypothetical protein E2F43_10795 [Seongchinamella unica]|uniref:Uncharacterized protein n=1 Tax=Seongchinamella unica TaxID=2547392 RepID=A0A4R5LSS4_9GAMM|nr:hypothetical protein [Seongchinamella unica]TDG13973.1 hypothetical protein E2F43_10795 [Seongchinamella unica]
MPRDLINEIENQDSAKQETLLEMYLKQLKGQALARLQGATFGIGDEVLGAEAALLSYVGDDYDDDMSFIDRYKNERDLIRADMEAFQQEHPVISTGSELFGAMGGPGKGLDKFVRGGQTLLSKGARLAFGGAAEGALAGAGYADELEDVPVDASEGAVTGALAAPVMATGLGIAGKALSPVASGAKKVLDYVTEAPEQAAIRNVMPLIYKDELLELGPLGSIPDASDEARRLLRGLHAQNPNLSGELEGALKLRQQGTVNRIAEGLVTDNELRALENQIKRSRSRIAKSQYAKAYESTIPLEGDFKKVMNTSDMKTAYRRAEAIAQRLGEDIPSLKEITDGDEIEYLPLKAVDYMKRALDSKIIRASRQGGDDYRSLLVLKSRLTDLTDEASPEYAKARQFYTTDTRLLDALTTGRGLYKASPTDLKEQLRSMSAPEQNMFRKGAQNAIVERLRTGKRMGNPELRLADSEDRLDALRLAFEMDDEYQDFLKVIDRESAFTQTQQMIRGGSPTARIENDLNAVESGLDFATGNYGAMAKQIFSNIKGSAQGKQAEEMMSLLSKQGWSAEEIDDLLTGQRDIPAFLPESYHQGLRSIQRFGRHLTPYSMVGGVVPVMQ